MHALAPRLDDDRPREDNVVILHGVSWADYQHILEVRGDHSAPRISYLEGELEIMSPSETHERIKSFIGRLVETWCLEHDIEFSPVGAWTISDQAKERGVEPDECYVFGDSREAERPELAIEVIWTSGRISKLEIYRQLNVREVWMWRRGTITPYVLRGDKYERVESSEVLPGIDLDQLASLLDHNTVSVAIKAYRALIRSSHPSAPTSST